jgi:hypothetical protein
MVMAKIVFREREKEIKHGNVVVVVFPFLVQGSDVLFLGF